MPAGSRCRGARAGVDALVKINRPVVLQLSALNDNYAVAHFGESAVRVDSRDGTRWLDPSDIVAYWSGLYFDVFEVPGYVPEVMREGDRGPAVLWLKQVASRAKPAYRADPDDPYFGPALSQWASGFQSAHGLDADGLVGEATIQLLARFQDPV